MTTKKRKELDTILGVESILTELMLTEGWSSRLEAERIIDFVKGKSKEVPKKPWQHFAIGKH